MRDFKKEIEDLHSNIKVVGEVVNGATKVDLRCSIDDYEWRSRPYDLLKGSGCHMCAGVPRYTTKTFKNRLSQVNDRVTVLGEYERSHSKILCKCNSCGDEFKIKPNALLNGNSCRICSYKKRGEGQRKTTNEFKKEVFDLVGNEYAILGDYKTTDDDILMRHNICGDEFSSRPHNFLSGSRCPKCNGGVRKKSTDYYKEELFNLVGDEYEFKSEYIGSQENSIYFHESCGRAFTSNPSNFNHQGSRCPHCCTPSRGESEVSEALNAMGIDFVKEKSFDGMKFISKLRFDFYVPAGNIAIEFDGRQHFEPVDAFGGTEEFELTKKRDEQKNAFCEENQINLLRIPYTENDITSCIERFMKKVNCHEE